MADLGELVEILVSGTGSHAEKRWKAAEELGRMGPAAAVAALSLSAAVATDPNALVRCNAAEALGSLGPAAAVAVPILIEAMKKDGCASVQCEAVKALGRIASPAVAAIREAAHHWHPRVAAAAAETLGLLDGEPEDAKRDTGADT